MLIKGLFCLSLHKNICCGYSLESPWLHKKHMLWVLIRIASSMFLWRTDKNYPSKKNWPSEDTGQLVNSSSVTSLSWVPKRYSKTQNDFHTDSRLIR